jgi:hypothetical protein
MNGVFSKKEIYWFGFKKKNKNDKLLLVTKTHAMQCTPFISF